MTLQPHDWFGLISVALAAIGYSSYILSILQRKTKPHLFSWAIWTVMMGIVFVAQAIKGAGAGAWVTGFSAFACFVIALLAFPRGEKTITTSDWVALTGAMFAIPVWYITHDPLWAVILATVIDALAYYPTFRKSYHKPFEENFFTYLMDTIKWVVAFMAMESFSVTTMLYPLFLIFANGGLIVMLLVRRGIPSTPRGGEGGKT